MADNEQLARDLLEAEATFREARSKHDAERTELSRRVLEEAREQLDELERRAKETSTGEISWAPLQCPECGERPRVARWSSQGVRETTNGAVSIRTTGDAPSWAVPFALQGVEVVTRYSCPKCEREIAVLGRDE